MLLELCHLSLLRHKAYLLPTAVHPPPPFWGVETQGQSMGVKGGRKLLASVSTSRLWGKVKKPTQCWILSVIPEWSGITAPTLRSTPYRCQSSHQCVSAHCRSPFVSVYDRPCWWVLILHRKGTFLMWKEGTAHGAYPYWEICPWSHVVPIDFHSRCSSLFPYLLRFVSLICSLGGSLSIDRAVHLFTFSK